MGSTGNSELGHTLYLMKGAALLGRIVYRPHEGYRFYPQTSAHRASRVAHATVLKAIPRWAEKLATDLLDRNEFEARVRPSREAA